MARLGNHYAAKILGAAQLPLYDATTAFERKQEAASCAVAFPFFCPTGSTYREPAC